ncbi:structural polyprotein, partial [Striga asiatica]
LDIIDLLSCLLPSFRGGDRLKSRERASVPALLRMSGLKADYLIRIESSQVRLIHSRLFRSTNYGKATTNPAFQLLKCTKPTLCSSNAKKPRRDVLPVAAEPIAANRKFGRTDRVNVIESYK